MNFKKNKRWYYLIIVWVTALSLPILGLTEEDEISPETLPDELPKVTLIDDSQNEKATDRVPQNQNEASETVATKETAETSDDELSKPIPPLFPTAPFEFESKLPKEKTKTEMDAELANPDPAYIAPQVAATKSKDIQPTATDQSKNVNPQIKTAPLKAAINSEMIVTKVRQVLPTRVSTLKTKPKWNPKIPLVLAPQLLSQIMAEGTRGIPIDTFISKLAVPPTEPSRPPKGTSDVSIILANNEFFPSKVILKANSDIRLLFTTTNKKPAALVIEKLKVQRWVASTEEGKETHELDRSTYEVNRELTASRVTEIEFEPKPGTYSFHDVMSGASGEIIVEEQ